MTIDRATFIVEYKEFEPADSATVTAAITRAQQVLEEAAFGDTDLYEDAVFCKAAAFLLDQSFGASMGNGAAQSENRYKTMFREQFLPLIRRRMQISGGGLT